MLSIKLGGVSLNAPDGYLPRMLVLAGPEETFGFGEKPFLRSVVLQCERLGKSADDLDNFAEKQTQALAKGMQGFKKVKSGLMKVAGQDCPYVEATNLGPGGVMLTNLIAFYVKGDVGYTLSAAHLTGKRYEGVKQEFQQIFQSLVV